jgi:predicted dehydrogenase/threonine dehydrogenase-like Zn-dependent dehydrogenase
MRALLENVRSGEVTSYEVPAPELRAGGILVQTAFSAISAGTERAHREQVEKSMIGKAMARPDIVRQVIDFAKAEGIKAAYQRVQTRLDSLSPLGYSCAGTIIGVSEDVRDFRVGDRVSCGGAGYANHSEVNFIPVNLAASVPDNVGLDAASLTTIGAIAVQGLRQSQVVFGENVVVIGAGLVGVLTVQLAKAAGCRVVAIDIDAGRVRRAVDMGANLGLVSEDGHTPAAVKEFTQFGADVAVITAATPSTAPIELAARVLRDRGRIVVVGDVGLGVSRSAAYHKELSVTLSRSYGPGRYDTQYEEGGVDYPIGYVRWTEKRNMEAFLGLLASGAINVAPLIARRHGVQDGAKAYSELKETGAYTVLIEYPAAPQAQTAPSVERKAAPRLVATRDLQIGCIGAGSFARNVIFPAIKNCKGVSLHSVATASGIAAESARRSFGFGQAQNPADLLQDDQIDAVFVLSRHDSHARYVNSALSRHKPVFVEKPLAIDRKQLEEVCYTVAVEKERGHSPFLMVGFNRRFAPMTTQLRQFFSDRREPMMVHIRINAGFIPGEHWTQQKQDGGRIVGEVCHFVDWARSVIGSPIQSVTANALPDHSRYNRDNLVATLSFADGSLANLIYVANGDKSVPKEFFEVFCEGSVARLDDFCSLELSRNSKTQRTKAMRDKGHKLEIQLTLDAIREGTAAPIPFDELIEVSETTLAMGESIAEKQPVKLRLPEVHGRPLLAPIETANR